MARPVLSRLDVFLYKDKSQTDKAQVPLAGALVEFYYQGATVSLDVTIVPGASVPVSVYNVGALAASTPGHDVFVQVGPGNGPVLKILGRSGSILTVQNSGHSTAVIAKNTRLFLISERPTVYDSPTAASPVAGGCFVRSDSTGRVLAYVAARRFDYVVRDPAAIAVLYHSETPQFVGQTTLSWSHNSPQTGSNRCIVVAIAHSDTPGDIVSARYGTTPLHPVAIGANLAVFSLKGISAGTQTIEIVFDSPVNAVGGAIELSGVDQLLDPSFAVFSLGLTSPASVNLIGITEGHHIVDVLEVALEGLVINPAPAAPQMEIWDLAVGNPLDRGCAASERVGSSSVPLTMAWTISPAKPWQLAAVDLKPVAREVHIDAEGGARPNPSWLNARDFPSLQDAVNALPAEGGEIFVPAGNHPVFTTLNIDRPNVTLRGEGTLVSGIVSVQNPNYPLVKITAANCRLLDLLIFGVADAAGTTPCLLLEGPQVVNCYLENVQLEKARHIGLHLKDIDSVLAVNTQAGDCRGAGLRIERSALSTVPTRAMFIGCEFSSNDGRGVEIEAAAGKEDNSIILLGCNMENNTPAINNAEGSSIHVLSTRGIQIIGCYCEHANPEIPPDIANILSFVDLIVCPGAVIDACLFSGHKKVYYGARIMDCPFARFTNNNGVELSLPSSREDLPGFLVYFFENEPTQAVEFGNTQQGEDFPRIDIDGANVFGLSRGVVQLLWVAVEPDPTGLPEGALVWNNTTKALRVIKNGAWRTVQLVPASQAVK